MIVDDHPSFRRFAARMLAAAGYDVVGEAPDAATALVEAKRLRPALVLLDVLLPDGNGIDIADRLASEARIVLLTSSRAASDLGSRLGTRAFVSKSDLTVKRLAALINGD